MKAIVKESNRARIEAELTKAQGRARERLVSYDDILNDIEHIERGLSRVPKRYWQGARFRVDRHAQNFPQSYKWRAESTQYTLTRGETYWTVSSIERDTVSIEGRGYEFINVADKEMNDFRESLIATYKYLEC